MKSEQWIREKLKKTRRKQNRIINERYKKLKSGEFFEIELRYLQDDINMLGSNINLLNEILNKEQI